MDTQTTTQRNRQIDFLKEMSQIQGSGRIQWLDSLKGILILFVILHHSYPAEIYRRMYTPFFLTMFFFASGYTFSPKENFRMFLKSKWKRLLCPFFTLGLVRVLMAYILEGGSFTKRLIGFVLQRSCMYDEMWFVSCLFTCSLLFYLIVRISEHIDSKWDNYVVLGISLVFTALGMADMCIWRFKLIWEAEIACMMSFYMGLGYLARKKQAYLEKWLNRPLWLSGLTGIYFILVFLVPNDVDIHLEKFSYPVLFFASSILILFPIVYLAKRISRFRWNRYLAFIGRNTLFYYSFAGIVRILLYSVLNHFNISDIYIQPLVCVLLTAVLLAWPAWFTRRYFPWAVGA
ncbi:MAG: acyltransferase [Oscillospiraceae bacterium]|nr:acyltransferase [Oscillospiraceae bacterium]